MSIRCVTFDWGDTLAVNYGMPWSATQRRHYGRLAETLARAGYQVAAEWRDACLSELAQAWRNSVDPQANPEGREFDWQAMLDRQLARVGASRQDPAVAQANDALIDAMAEVVMPYPEAAPVLAALRRLGLRLGILSHVPTPSVACRRWYQRHGLAQHLDFYSLSCELGFIKPHPAHYRHALEQAGCPAHEVLHVGDHPWRDIEGGRAFGFRTCLRRTEGIYPEERLDACRPDAEILHLDELPGVIASLA